MTTRRYWLMWAIGALVLSTVLAAMLTTTAVTGKAMFLPGTTTAGHYQIELACRACHTPFAGVTNDACLRCHGDGLTAAHDSHPRGKFTDPRSASLTERLDATRCVTCHREHVPDATHAMGVTVPGDFCITCHADVRHERPSHASFTFDTCTNTACHHYHDNTALYEDFLVAHARDAAMTPQPRVPVRASLAPGAHVAARLLADAPSTVRIDATVRAALESTSHARAGVNCRGCHTRAGARDQATAWIDRPGQAECAACHARETAGFGGGRHGMRPASGLPPMRPGLARLPMKAAARDRELSCSSCHASHDFDTRRAAVDACLTCHDDGHSRAYRASPHAALWTRELAGSAPPGSGVSCATCHLPRQRLEGSGSVTVEHNQNANLRPNEKMVRTVCLPCHGLTFSLDSLADRPLIARNFAGQPRHVVTAVDMALRRRGRT